MTRLKFTGEMFEELGTDVPKMIAFHAQQIYDNWLEEQPEVYKSIHDEILRWTLDKDTATQKARLVCIEEIEKKECEHVPYWHSVKGGSDIIGIIGKCLKCGKPIKATAWEEVATS